jgi:predicted alpha/beta-fold hydrolase
VSESIDNFSPAWWLPGPHAQTLWSQFFRRRVPAISRVEPVPTPDGDTVFLHHSDAAAAGSRLLLLHGLEGSVRSHYVAGIFGLARLRGWNASLLEFRGCGDELNRAPRLYHSGETTDLDTVVNHLTAVNPDQRLFLAGISLGGNVLLKWLGENPAGVPRQVMAAGAISTPFDLEAGARNLQRGFARVYDRHFLESLRNKALRKLEQYPGMFDRGQLAAARTIEDFDDAVTGPVHGFDGSHDYYTKSSSIRFLHDICKPTLLINSADDPFLPSTVLDAARQIANSNANLRVCFTRDGGHVGFVGGLVPFRPSFWAEARLMAFFDSI